MNEGGKNWERDKKERRIKEGKRKRKERRKGIRYV